MAGPHVREEPPGRLKVADGADSTAGGGPECPADIARVVLPVGRDHAERGAEVGDGGIIVAFKDVNLGALGQHPGLGLGSGTVLVGEVGIAGNRLRQGAEHEGAIASRGGTHGVVEVCPQFGDEIVEIVQVETLGQREGGRLEALHVRVQGAHRIGGVGGQGIVECPVEGFALVRT